MYSDSTEHFSNKTVPNILVNVIYSYNRVDTKRSDTSSDVFAHFTRAFILMIKDFADVIITDITAGQKSLLCKNCALHIIPAIW